MIDSALFNIGTEEGGKEDAQVQMIRVKRMNFAKDQSTKPTKIRDSNVAEEEDQTPRYSGHCEYDDLHQFSLSEKEENVLPREVIFDPITDQPIHIDFLRIVKGGKITIEIPVKFINSEKSPGLKRGGVLNIVRRKVELKCPTENIPKELIVDLENVDIGESFKISSIKLPENVTPTIQGRDFVVATLAAPTIIKEPEKPAEETAEGAEGTEATAEAGAEGEAKPAEGEKKEADKKEGDKKEDKKAPAEKK